MQQEEAFPSPALPSVDGGRYCMGAISKEKAFIVFTRQL